MTVILIASLGGIVILVAWVVIAERLDPPQREPRNPLPGPVGHPRVVQVIDAGPAGGRPAPDLGALTPGPVGTGWLEALPDDDPADTTGIQPAATRYLGTPLEQYVDELFDKHAEATP